MNIFDYMGVSNTGANNIQYNMSLKERIGKTWFKPALIEDSQLASDE